MALSMREVVESPSLGVCRKHMEDEFGKDIDHCLHPTSVMMVLIAGHASSWLQGLSCSYAPS